MKKIGIWNKILWVGLLLIIISQLIINFWQVLNEDVGLFAITIYSVVSLIGLLIILISIKKESISITGKIIILVLLLFVSAIGTKSFCIVGGNDEGFFLFMVLVPHILMVLNLFSISTFYILLFNWLLKLIQESKNNQNSKHLILLIVEIIIAAFYIFQGLTDSWRPMLLYVFLPVIIICLYAIIITIFSLNKTKK
ncbi:MAG: hypothetical protein IKR74_05425 [Bacilli bacterium]|nr:hypothetical protein [Bacilli bacterium]